MPTVGTTNSFPRGQCTWWASERYYQLTGKRVPWRGDAWSWANGARTSGWQVSSVPPPNTPAIVVLAPGTQGADRGLGHVGVVEQASGTGVRASNLNWNGNQTSPTLVNFRNGPGVLYAWYPGATRLPNAPALPTGTIGKGTSSVPTTTNPTGTPTGSGQGVLPGEPTPTGTIAGLAGLTIGGGPAYMPLLWQVHNTLVSNPGFYGVALAVDEAEQFPGWVNLATGPTDFIGFARSVGASFSDNFPPVLIRGSLILLGVAIATLLVARVIVGVAETSGPILEKVLPLVGA